jgi:hypothetical protein
MKDLKQLAKSESVTVRLLKSEAESLQNEANNELLSISALVRRKLFFNRLKATA